MKIRTASLALAAGFMVAAPTAAFSAPAQIAHVEKSATAPAKAPLQDASRYAERQAQDKQVADYEGGNTVVVVMSGGALVVLLFLLLIL